MERSSYAPSRKTHTTHHERKWAAPSRERSAALAILQPGYVEDGRRHPDVIYFDDDAGDSQVDLGLHVGLGFLGSAAGRELLTARVK